MCLCVVRNRRVSLSHAPRPPATLTRSRKLPPPPNRRREEGEGPRLSLKRTQNQPEVVRRNQLEIDSFYFVALCFWCPYKWAHISSLEALTDTKVFACCSALKVALASLISFDSETGPKIKLTQGYSLVFSPNLGSL